MSGRKIVYAFPLVALLIAVSYFALDKSVALLIRKMWMSGAGFSFFSAEIPDFLPFLVLLITGFAWAASFYLARKKIYNTHTRFFQLLSITVPLAYAFKEILKFAFGRIETRLWLRHPGPAEFHWFQGSEQYGGFPSGHMAVITVLAAALSFYYPRYRTISFAGLILLALALILTNYHFLSDIIAGAYTGLIVHSVTHSLLTKSHGSKENSAEQ